MPPVWQTQSSIYRRVLRSGVCQAAQCGLHGGTGRYAVRKAGFALVQRAASARAPSRNLPPCTSKSVSSTHRRSLTPALRPSCVLTLRGLGARHPVIFLFHGHLPGHSCHLVRQCEQPQPSLTCVPPVRPASGLYCRLCGPPNGLLSWRQRSAGGGCRSGPSF